MRERKLIDILKTESLSQLQVYIFIEVSKLLKEQRSLPIQIRLPIICDELKSSSMSFDDLNNFYQKIMALNFSNTALVQNFIAELKLVLKEYKNYYK